MRAGRLDGAGKSLSGAGVERLPERATDVVGERLLALAEHESRVLGRRLEGAPLDATATSPQRAVSARSPARQAGHARFAAARPS